MQERKDKEKNKEQEKGDLRWNIAFNEALIAVLVVALLSAWLKFFSPALENNILVIVSIAGVLPVAWSAAKAIWRRKITIDLLASIALAFTFIKGEWLSAAFINLMLASARLFDNFTEVRTKHVIERLMKLRPERVKIKIGEKLEDVPLDRVKIGDLVVVEAGERIPVDGIVVQGQASIDQSTLTGESEHVTKKEGDKVWSSTLNDSGSLLVRAERVGADTTLAKMIALVDEASRAKTSIERIADRFSTYYIILSLVGSFILYVASGDLNLVLSVLLVTCADDIAVAVPLGFTIAIAKAGKEGVIVKGAAIFERIKRLKVFVTDKTGTLTKGMAHVVDIVRFGDISENDFLKLVGTCQTNSRHPVSLAMLRFLKEKQVSFPAPDEFHETPGDGIAVTKDGTNYCAGKISFLESNGIKFTEEEKKRIDDLEMKGYSLTAFGSGGRLIGLMVLEDEIRPLARVAVAETRRLGAERWVMLTGDNERVAKKVSDEVGLDGYHANLKPEDKLRILKEIKKKYPGDLAMMGDGVNDAAALALADVSIAMGAIGSDAAIEAADIALMHDSVKKIPELMFLSKKSMRIINNNFWIWGVTNALGLVLVFGGVLGPTGAAAYNFVTDFFPVVNVFQIYFLKTKLKATVV